MPVAHAPPDGRRTRDAGMKVSARPHLPAALRRLLGYTLYATVYGALGSLGSRVEDAQSVAGPVMVVMAVAYFASFVTVGKPDSTAAKALSYFPLTAPMAMPGRIAMGAAAWWEPVVAAALTLAAIAGLVVLAGRVYTRAILHSGPALSLRDIWRGKAAKAPNDAARHESHGSCAWLCQNRRLLRVPANTIPIAARAGGRAQELVALAGPAPAAAWLCGSRRLRRSTGPRRCRSAIAGRRA
jgi:hypothetical protein